MEREDMLTEKDRKLIEAAYLLGYRRGYDTDYDTVEDALKKDETSLQIDNLLFEHGEEIYIRNSNQGW